MSKEQRKNLNMNYSHSVAWSFNKDKKCKPFFLIFIKKYSKT
jgi:hypothetical protein